MIFGKQTKKIVVLIEDDAILSKNLADELTESGYDVRKALDGKKGLTLIKRLHPDVVLLDLNLPKKPGLHVLDDVRTDGAIKNIPVIIMTVESDYEHFKESLQYNDGETHYITKTDKTLADVVRKVRSVCGSPGL